MPSKPVMASASRLGVEEEHRVEERAQTVKAKWFALCDGKA